MHMPFVCGGANAADSRPSDLYQEWPEMVFAEHALMALEFAVIVPLGLFITLLIVRFLSWIWHRSLNRRPPGIRLLAGLPY